MIISQDTMDRMHDLQYEMLKELIRVMDILNIDYYFVHGSLLGAIRDHDFIAEDDDIDIAIFRKDYNRLMMRGNALLGEDYFIQNSGNDGYPLSFAKLRKQNTAFIQPVLENTKCNQGIYIDIFPIDFENNNFFSKTKIKLLDRRISQIFPQRPSDVKNKCKDVFVKILFPSFDAALWKREILLSSRKESQYLCIHNGKTSETHMPISWFDDYDMVQFRDIYVKCPKDSSKYLARIYGENYINHNPAEKRAYNSQIEISAEILDFEKSYLDYE